MDSSKLKAAIIVVLAAFFALYLGIAAATAQMEAVAWVVGALGIVCVLALGKHVWLLIPLALSFDSNLNFIPGSPPPWALAAAVATIMYIVRFLARANDLKFRFGLLDFAVLLQFLAVAQAFVRNPTGLLILGGDTAGGKSYFMYAAAILCFFCIGSIRPNFKLIKIACVMMIVVAVLDGTLYTLTDFLPSVGAVILPFYSGGNVVNAVAGQANTDLSQVRGGYGVRQIGLGLAKPAMSLYPPLSCLNPLHIGRFAAFTLGFFGVLLSGFRSMTGFLACYFIIASIIRRRVADVVIGGSAAFILLCVIMISGIATSLPFGAQRVLSVLPIEVSAAARADAENSSEWRFEMWRLALFTDRYIDNKMLGDGFAFNANEMRAALDAAAGYETYLSGSSQEQAMLRGSYHGFHVETIRFTGILGLLCAVIGLFIFCGKAWKLSRYFEGRKEWGYVIYLCIPFILHPFWYLFVFGSYKVGFPVLLASAGFLKMLENIKIEELAEAKIMASAGEPAPSRRPSAASA